MNHIEIRKVQTRREKNTFLTFPWRIYRGDPFWVPPLLPERKKVIDPHQGKFYEDGYAELFMAWKDGRPVGTISCGEDLSATRSRDFGECQVGFFECVNDYSVAEALFDRATVWANEHALARLVGTYNLDREELRGILIEGATARRPSIAATRRPIIPNSSSGSVSSNLMKTGWRMRSTWILSSLKFVI